LAVLTRVPEPITILTALQAVQEEFGYVPPDALPAVADACNASRADVYGVLTYYSDLRSEPPADTVIRVCLGEACQAVGARDLHRAVTPWAGDSVEVDHVYCLGNCALGPAATVNGRLLGRATADRVSAAARGAG